MTRRAINSIIDEYLFLKRKVAKCVVKSKKNPKAVLTNRKILLQARGYVRRMLEIEDECNHNGWPHPDVFEPGYKDPSADIEKLTVEREMGGKTLTRPDGTLPNSKIQALPLADPTVIRGRMPVDSGIKILDDIPLNPDGTLFETPKLEGSFIKRRSETD